MGKRKHAKDAREEIKQMQTANRQQKSEAKKENKAKQQNNKEIKLPKQQSQLTKLFSPGKKAAVSWDAPFRVYVETLSPIHLGSGKGDVIVDAEVVHDAVGLPYFPAKRFKGLLYESAMEVVEIMGDEPLFEKHDVKALFRHGTKTDTGAQIVISNLRLKNYEAMREEWTYLQNRFPELLQPQDVLEQYTSFRYQTRIDPVTRMAADTSLHNMRVVNKGVIFEGDLSIENGGEAEGRILALALRNLERAGLKRNRGFGKIRCVLTQDKKNVGSLIVGTALKAWKEGQS